MAVSQLSKIPSLDLDDPILDDMIGALLAKLRDPVDSWKTKPL